MNIRNVSFLYFSDPSPHGLMHFQIGFCSLFILSTSSKVSGNLEENHTYNYQVLLESKSFRQEQSEAASQH